MSILYAVIGIISFCFIVYIAWSRYNRFDPDRNIAENYRNRIMMRYNK